MGIDKSVLFHCFDSVGCSGDNGIVFGVEWSHERSGDWRKGNHSCY